MNSENNKNEYAKHISLFLAELLRTRKIQLERAAEIAQKVVQNINLIDNEVIFLKFVKELSFDFDELLPLEERVSLYMRVGERKELENKVTEYAVRNMTTDIHKSNAILQEAANDGIKLMDLYQKFPDFKQFVDSTTSQSQPWTKIK
ncbi:MAG: hypothetical protein KW804_03445 [Candidatus Doudnabacteria bacterium]|nr:hypothetical protein [Candidatus Doudnabacteria bacterium]